jgi:hypothetical protein
VGAARRRRGSIGKFRIRGLTCASGARGRLGAPDDSGQLFHLRGVDCADSSFGLPERGISFGDDALGAGHGLAQRGDSPDGGLDGGMVRRQRLTRRRARQKLSQVCGASTGLHGGRKIVHLHVSYGASVSCQPAMASGFASSAGSVTMPSRTG